MQVLPFLGLLLGLPVLLWAFLAFDALVIVQRDRHPYERARDGNPRPMLRMAREFPRSRGSSLATHARAFTGRRSGLML